MALDNQYLHWVPHFRNYHNTLPTYYLVTFVLHDQNNSIRQQVAKLEASIKNAGFNIEYIHTGPVIRREDIFCGYTIDERRKLLYKMLNFINTCPIAHFTVAINRRETSNKVELSGKLAKAIHSAASTKTDFFANYEKAHACENQIAVLGWVC